MPRLSVPPSVPPQHTDGVYRGEKLINLKQISDEALEKSKEK